jgi:hypothetical protein
MPGIARHPPRHPRKPGPQTRPANPARATQILHQIDAGRFFG